MVNQDDIEGPRVSIRGDALSILGSTATCLWLSVTSKCRRPFEKKYVGKCISTCLCVPLCAFYLLTLRTGIPVPRTCRLSSQRDTERGQSEQRSFVRRECGHEKFGKRHGLRNITKLLLKSPFGRKPSTFDIGA